MAKLIEFYIPQKHKSRERWVPPRLRGRVVAFEVRSEDLNRLFSERVRVVSRLSRTGTP
jgi:hypothetical protein